MMPCTCGRITCETTKVSLSRREDEGADHRIKSGPLFLAVQECFTPELFYQTLHRQTCVLQTSGPVQRTSLEHIDTTLGPSSSSELALEMRMSLEVAIALLLLCLR
mmetsp:Transcript_13899/g.20353  ORF Transcript_13899/g.20353 Transcript_13899/m.20353 type:complete len:106 (-) Transcript_13899:248-565(-)